MSEQQKRLKPLDGLPAGSLMICEIFASIQGESSHVGLPCAFVRTTACDLRCRWCDTPYAFTEGKPMTADEVVTAVDSFGLRLVELTGGEPLLQPAIHPLMTMLCDKGYTVLLETSGAIDVSSVDPRVIKILDLKTPSSGEERSNLYENIEHLTRSDEIKIVVADRADYEWARDLILERRLGEVCQVIVGTVFERLETRELASWILTDRLPVRLQVQLHKIIWGGMRGV